MKKFYNKNWLFNRKTVATLVALLFTAGMAMAQYSGTLTVDSSSAPSATNFQSFSDLSDSLETYGVNGAVTVNVTAAPGGSYNESVTFNVIFGTSSTNTITINGNGATITRSTAGAVIELNGADYMTFDNLVVDNAAATGTGIRCFWIHNSSDYTTVENCELISSAYASPTSSASGYVVFSGSATLGHSTGSHGMNCVIDNNTMWGGSLTATTGMYYGILDYRSTSYTGGTIISDNDIMHMRYSGIRSNYVADADISGNTISNNHSTATSFYGILSSGWGTHNIEGNTIENISKTNTSFFYGINCNGSGSSATPFVIKDNVIDNITTSGGWRGIYVYFDNYWDITGNEVSNVSTSNNYSESHGIYVYYGSNVNVVDNNVHHIETYHYRGSGIFMYRTSNGNITDNTVDNVFGKYYASYGIYTYFMSNGHVDRNTVTNITQDPNYGWGYSYGIYFFYPNNSTCNNNILYGLNGTYYYYNIYAYGYGSSYTNNTVANNTIDIQNKPDNHIGNIYGIYCAPNNSSEIDLLNNNVLVSYNSSIFSISYRMTTGIEENRMDYNNTSFATTVAPLTYGTVGGTGYTTLAGFNTATGAHNGHNMGYDPEFVDTANGDYTPQSVEMANRGLGNIVTDDVTGASRNTCGVDPGAIEYYTDFSASNFTLSGADRCGGTSDDIVFDVTNSYSDSRSFLRVYYTLNGDQTDEQTDTLFGNSTMTYTFNDMPVYHDPGLNTVTVGILCDDNSANNELTQTFNVVSSPSGGDIVESGTFEGYFNAGNQTNPDIAVPNTTSIYDIVAPTKYGPSGYGTDWDITDNSMTSGGMATTGLGVTVDGSAMTVTVDPDSSLTDSLIYVSFVINDLNTGCDSTVGRWMYVPFTPDVDFDIADVCLGTIATFKNNSQMGGNDFMIYKWNYNDPNSNEDTSEIKNGFWDYSTFGTFDVTLEVRNQSYPKFAYSVTKQITVTPTPNTDFSVINACEGDLIVFNDATTVDIPGAVTYDWDFGDGNGSTAQNPTHLYAAATAQGYDVTLKATQNGCDASVTKKAYQFARPVAGFSTTGACNLEDIQFNNSTTLAIGKAGFTWDFGDNGVSTLSDPTHAYSASGKHTVKLIAYSEFGCEDEVTVEIDLLESPEADFTYDATCNLTPVNFTRTGSVPAGIASDFIWDFNGEGSSTNENPSFLFSEVGSKEVTLTINSVNGCSSTYTEELDVVLQAVADFEVADICEGDEAVFTNKSSVAAGDLSYTWLFGAPDDQGVTTSDHVSPRHRYASTGSTRIVNVTLVAEVAGGCDAELTLPLTINAAPDATFSADVQGRTVVLDAVAGHSIYQWRFGNGGSSTMEDPVYTYNNVDEGEFEICLSVKNDECWNESCDMVSVDLVGVEELTQDNAMINVYPNPSTGVFNLEVVNATDDITIAVSDVLGNQLDVNITDNLNGSFIVDLSNVADGVYFVQVKNGDYYATKRITVSK
ncbi:MAG: PKD domain-containing protein [Bacteroidia bacterium]